MLTQKRKLIEVALPLEAINRESAREKSIRHGHPSTLHLWWARRPLAAARAVLFAQLVDDPSSHPDRFPTEADVTIERKRLHDLIEKMVVWENLHDEALFRQVHQEILDSCAGDPPPILDPFAGGGTIPLEAQRLGLTTHASDLNPVAVLINKALIDIPPRFANRPPVNPDSSALRNGSWPTTAGLADDLRYYGAKIRDAAESLIGDHYPDAKLDDGTTARTIAWVWARTVRCPNPACGIEMPLVRSWWLGKKKGKEAWVVPSVAAGQVSYRIGRPPSPAPSPDSGSVGRTGAICVGCDAAVDLKYIRSEGRESRLGAHLIAIVAEGRRTRYYLDPTDEHRDAANISRPSNPPDGSLPTEALGFRVQAYGLRQYADLFTARQLTALMTFSDLVVRFRDEVETDALSAGWEVGERLESGGSDAAAYADSVATYLATAISRGADLNNSLVTWSNSRNQARNLFSRQAIPMAWDFVEVSPFGGAAGDLGVALKTSCEALATIPVTGSGTVSQVDAQVRPTENFLLSTDPPYYDNIGYSDLSDFFYIWLRRALGSIHSTLLSTILVPKADELIANPYRHGGKEGARNFFENGFNTVFSRARSSALQEYPIAVYYAFKQSETTNQGEASTGWETLLQGMIQSGWSITATWPMRSERSGRMRDVDSNALASSIVLALRSRDENAPRTARRGFIAALKSELPAALKELQQGAIAPVDLPQAAIGPGMAVFSRYSAVLNDNGSPMKVRDALTLINEVLDEVLSEQEGDFDSETRFALAWFRQHGFDAGEFGDADNLARARNASLEYLERAGILTLRGTRGRVALLPPSILSPDWNPATDASISVWQVVMHLSRTLNADGIVAASTLLSCVPETIDRDLCKELSFLLFAIAENSKRTKVAIDFNALGTAWNEIAAGVHNSVEQGTFDYTGD